MSIASMSELLARALRGGYALGYFEAWDQYSLEAVLEAAEPTSPGWTVGVWKSLRPSRAAWASVLLSPQRSFSMRPGPSPKCSVGFVPAAMR